MPALTFLGHGAFTLDLIGGRLVIDPFLTGNPLAKVTAGEIKADYVLLTHGHPDCFVRKAAQAGLRARVLAVGETLSI